MAKKRKVKGKATGANRSRADLAKQLEAERKVNAKLQDDVNKVAGQMIDARRSNEKLTRRLEESLQERGEMNDQIEEMYRESYALVKCLNATREKWLDAEDKVTRLERGQQMQAFTMKVEIADATQDGDDPACTFVGPAGAKAD